MLKKKKSGDYDIKMAALIVNSPNHGPGSSGKDTHAVVLYLKIKL